MSEDEGRWDELTFCLTRWILLQGLGKIENPNSKYGFCDLGMSSWPVEGNLEVEEEVEQAFHTHNRQALRAVIPRGKNRFQIETRWRWGDFLCALENQGGASCWSTGKRINHVAECWGKSRSREDGDRKRGWWEFRKWQPFVKDWNSKVLLMRRGEILCSWVKEDFVITGAALLKAGKLFDWER